MDVANWLRDLGLERYEAAFRENDVSAKLLLTLTADDLKEIGVTSFGHRRQLVEGIAALRLERTPADDPSASIGNLGSFETAADAERRPLSAQIQYFQSGGSRSNHCLLLIFCGTDTGMTAVSCGNPQSAVGVGGWLLRITDSGVPIGSIAFEGRWMRPGPLTTLRCRSMPLCAQRARNSVTEVRIEVG